MNKGLIASILVLLLVGCSTPPSLQRSLNIGSAMDDSALEVDILAALIEQDERFEASDLRLLAHHGRVLLVGQVPSVSMIQSANQVIQRQPRVRLLHNQLREGPARSTEMIVNDQWISVRVRTQLSLARDIPAQRVVVLTFQGTTYLLGRVTETQAEQIEQRTAGVSGVQRVVSMFDFVDSQ